VPTAIRTTLGSCLAIEGVKSTKTLSITPLDLQKRCERRWPFDFPGRRNRSHLEISGRRGRASRSPGPTRAKEKPTGVKRRARDLYRRCERGTEAPRPYLNNNICSLQWLDRRRGGSRGGGGRPRWGGRLRSCLIFGRRLIGHGLTVACRDTSVRACGSPRMARRARAVHAPRMRNRRAGRITDDSSGDGTDRPEHHDTR
jgi:hypothetical protein